MDDIVKYGRVRRAVLCVQIGEVEPTDARAARLTEIRGAKVQAFDPSAAESPSARAGIEIGDVIVAAAGQRVNRVSELQRVIRGFKPGEVVDIEVMRFGAKKSVRVRLAEPPRVADDQVASAAERTGTDPVKADERNNEKLGISVQPVPAEFITARRVADEYRRGLLVTDVSSRGPAYRELFANRDIILRILHPTRRDIRSAADLEQAVASLKRGDVLSLLVFDTAVGPGGSTKVVNVQID